MAKTIVVTDEQIAALKKAAEGQLGALDGVSRIYLAPKFQADIISLLVEILESSESGSDVGAVDAYTKAESDSKFLEKTAAFTKTTADGLYLGKTAKASSAVKADSATTAASATKATQDGSGKVISTTYATKAELGSYVTSAQLTEILKGYQPVTTA